MQLAQIIMITILASIPKGFEREAAKLAIEYAESMEQGANRAFEEAEEGISELNFALEEAAKIFGHKRLFIRSRSQLTIDSSVHARQPVFVPFAKASSFHSQSSYKSTEIW
ncbi:hypothetical protein PoB_005205300 [Plakobranchus ocellatus]|uniref:Uncharacterized protein n=1 Tax=Plakobranchus ocellatus TaxID=259542 RepID=A0AAV4C2A1_9GAST|nr:hypothetical protein PoB_005205300 [Plakobranchus ocellatus]